jgi:hypothetical protein
MSYYLNQNTLTNGRDILLPDDETGEIEVQKTACGQDSAARALPKTVFANECWAA